MSKPTTMSNLTIAQISNPTTHNSNNESDNSDSDTHSPIDPADDPLAATRGRLVPSFSLTPPDNTPLIGNYVTLRRLSLPRDTDALYTAVSGPGNDELWTYLKKGPFTNIDDFRENLDRYNNMPGLAMYTIFVHSKAASVPSTPSTLASAIAGTDSSTKDSPAPAAHERALGYAALRSLDLSSRAVEIGPLIFSPLLQRTPAGTETIYLLLHHAFTQLKCRRCVWTCNSLNTRSAAAARRYGFVHEGTERQEQIVKGRNRDTERFSMVDGREWEENRRVLEAWLEERNFDGEGRQRRGVAEVRRKVLGVRSEVDESVVGGKT